MDNYRSIKQLISQKTLFSLETECKVMKSKSNFQMFFQNLYPCTIITLRTTPSPLKGMQRYTSLIK